MVAWWHASQQLGCAKFAEEGVESQADFVGYFTASGHEKEAENVRDKVESLKGRTVETARIRMAYQIAVKVVEASYGRDQEGDAGAGPFGFGGAIAGAGEGEHGRAMDEKVFPAPVPPIRW